MDAIIGAQLAQAAYNPPAALDAALTGSLAAWSLLVKTGYPNQSRSQLDEHGAYSIFINDTDKQIVFAFKGSTLDNRANDFKADIGSNGNSVADPVVISANEALSNRIKINPTYSDYTITAVGHSLGGQEAQTFALVNSLSAYVNDSLPVSNASLADYAASVHQTPQQVIDAYQALRTPSGGGIKTINTSAESEIANWYYNEAQVLAERVNDFASPLNK